MLDHRSDTTALVTRPRFRAADAGLYLHLQEPTSSPAWTDDPRQATAFASMREAARAALRLPAAVRAFGVPRLSELSAAQAH